MVRQNLQKSYHQSVIVHNVRNAQQRAYKRTPRGPKSAPETRGAGVVASLASLPTTARAATATPVVVVVVVVVVALVALVALVGGAALSDGPCIALLPPTPC
jgi:hypothetical protein